MNRQRCATFALLVNLTIALAGVATHTSAASPQVDFRLPAGGSPPAPPTGISTDWWTAVQEDLRRSEYHVTWQEDPDLPGVLAAYQAPNRAHNLRTYFTPEGPVTIPRLLPAESATPSWHWGLRLVAWGWEGSLQPVDAAAPHANANRIEYRRGALTEWYVNDERGLEQGFTITRPPQQAGKNLILELALTGDLTPNLTGDGTAIEFTASDGSRILRYSDLRASDATGRRLTAHLEFLEFPAFLAPPEFPGFSPGNRSGVKVVVEDTAYPT